MLEFLTPRLRLRQITAADWPLFIRLHQEQVIIRYVFDEPSMEEIAAKFRVLLPAWQARPRQWLCMVVCCIKSGAPLGTMAFIITDAKHSHAEFGYMFLPEHFGKGYATEALLAAKQFALSLGITQLQATVTEGNAGSCRVLEKCGFVLSKRIEQAYSINNKLYDDLIYTYHSNQPNTPAVE
ncbi:MAG: GNAT family N-acetyltransferase [Gammaproteobacteria bacterium HGW-Gammaproteobacteria-15]|nr:MAG: GNAT family N-acetyltransferase [Gammaproteobacteria bacterium HGW-Gammaproteobacteria-15]